MRQMVVTLILMIVMVSSLFSGRTMSDHYWAAALFLAILLIYGRGIYILSCKTVYKEQAVFPVSRQNMLLGKTIITSLWGMLIGLSIWFGKIGTFWAIKSEDEFDSSGTVIYYFQVLAARLAECGMSQWEMTLDISLIPLYFLNIAAAVYLILSCIASFCYTSPYTKNPLAKIVVFGLCVAILCGAAWGGYFLTANSFPKILLCQLVIFAVSACALFSNFFV